MTTSKLLKSILLFLALSFMIACDSEELDGLNYQNTEITNDSDQLSARARGGNCFSLVYPISLSFPDGTESSFETRAEIKEAKRAFKQENPDAEERPTLVFPIDIVLEDGTTVTVESLEALQEVKSQCRGTRGTKCVSLVYPLSVQFPDGDVVEVADRRELKSTIKSYKNENPDAEERPSIVFPVDVELVDGTIQSVISKEELETLKEDC